MNKLLTTAALVALIASPAFAQEPRHPAKQVAKQTQTLNAYGRSESRSHSVAPSVDVFSATGRYVGSDPDARVRMDIQRDEGTTD